MKALFLIIATVFILSCYAIPLILEIQEPSHLLQKALQPKRISATNNYNARNVTYKAWKKHPNLSDRAAIILTSRNVVVFFLGTVMLLFISWLSNTRVFSFLSTMEHELMHGVVAVMCGGKFNAMTVTASKGGHAEVTSNACVRLAPYCLSLFCMMLCCVLPFLSDQAKIVGILFTGMAYGNFIRGNFPHIGIQTDIQKSGGKLLAYPLIFSANAVLVSGLMIFLTLL